MLVYVVAPVHMYDTDDTRRTTRKCVHDFHAYPICTWLSSVYSRTTYNNYTFPNKCKVRIYHYPQQNKKIISDAMQIILTLLKNLLCVYQFLYIHPGCAYCGNTYALYLISCSKPTSICIHLACRTPYIEHMHYVCVYRVHIYSSVIVWFYYYVVSVRSRKGVHTT